MLLSITKLCFSHEMGNCCFMPLDDDAQSETHEQLFHHREEVNNDGFDKWPFTEFFLSDITMATKNFSFNEIISENAEECPNVVYKGCLKDSLGFVAVKRFKNTPWPDPEGFAADAEEVSELKHKRLVKLLGYCCEEDERLLVAEFMPNDTLAKRLFHHQNNQPMEWSMRLRVAYHLVEALEYCNSKCFVSYTNLTAYSVLFDKDGDACLSSFGFVREVLYNEGRGGRVNPDSVTHRFGTILLNLLTGMPISPSHAPEVIKEKDVTKLMDPNLKGKFSTEEATKIFEIASECLQWRNIMSFITKDLVITLKTLQAKSIPYTEIAKPQEDGASSSQQQQIALSGKQKNPLQLL